MAAVSPSATTSADEDWDTLEPRVNSREPLAIAGCPACGVSEDKDVLMLLQIHTVGSGVRIDREALFWDEPNEVVASPSDSHHADRVLIVDSGALST